MQRSLFALLVLSAIPFAQPVALAQTTVPVAQRGVLRLLKTPRAEGNAILYVELAPGGPHPDVVKLQTEHGTATLRDDGKAPDDQAHDGIHSAYLTVSVDGLTATMRRLASAQAPIPIFAGREVVAYVKPRVVAANQIPSGSAAEALRSMPIIPSRLNPQGRVVRHSREIPVIDLPVVTTFDPAFIVPVTGTTDPLKVDPARTIAITDDSVVGDTGRTYVPCTMGGTGPAGDPNGKWTFHHLMDEMANTAVTGISTDAFVVHWARIWSHDQILNNFTVRSHRFVTDAILDPTRGFLKMDGTLDWSKSPFQLLAIMNRNDLRDDPLLGGTNAGEVRFVFGFVDTASCRGKPMTVIFEYGIRKADCFESQAWSRLWLNLQANALGTAGFNNALEAITVQFTEHGTNPAQMPNKSSLNQLRSNEQLGAFNWELREFHLVSDDGDAGHLREAMVKLTPDLSLNNTSTLSDYINSDAAAIIADKHTTPLEFPAGSAFLGGSSEMPINTRWDGPPPAPSTKITTPNSRFHFSLNTCNACHTGETKTGFQHIGSGDPVPLRQFSQFLTGDSTKPDGNFHVTDIEGFDRAFNDIMRRRVALAQANDEACFLGIFFDPLGMTH